MKPFAIFARIFTGAILIITWGLTTQPLSAVVFILVLTALSAIRYRFKLSKILIPFEIIACIIYAAIWPFALLGLWIPLISLFEQRANTLEQQLLKENFKIKAQHLKLENQREAVQSSATNAARLAELNERTRIAQDIHDHVGHEITGALIALQTAAKRDEIGNERADELLKSATTRLEGAYGALRETIYNLKPAKSLTQLQDLCENFTFCKINFTQNADLKEHSDIFAANLKEALTNISRHSTATLVTIQVDENNDYIRMIVADNGEVQSAKNIKNGLGITGMKDRIRMAGGTFTVSTENGFKITQILPKRRVTDEIINS